MRAVGFASRLEPAPRCASRFRPRRSRALRVGRSRRGRRATRVPRAWRSVPSPACRSVSAAARAPPLVPRRSQRGSRRPTKVRAHRPRPSPRSLVRPTGRRSRAGVPASRSARGSHTHAQRARHSPPGPRLRHTATAAGVSPLARSISMSHARLPGKATFLSLDSRVAYSPSRWRESASATMGSVCGSAIHGASSGASRPPAIACQWCASSRVLGRVVCRSVRYAAVTVSPVTTSN